MNSGNNPVPLTIPGPGSYEVNIQGINYNTPSTKFGKNDRFSKTDGLEVPGPG